MNRVMIAALVMSIAAATVCATVLYDSQRLFGLPLTLSQPTPVSDVNALPELYAGQTILVTGTIVNMSPRMGAWIELVGQDSAHVICRSMNGNVRFPEECMWRAVAVQGQVIMDPDARTNESLPVEHQPYPGYANPQVTIALEGALVTGPRETVGSPSAYDNPAPNQPSVSPTPQTPAVPGSKAPPQKNAERDDARKNEVRTDAQKAPTAVAKKK